MPAQVQPLPAFGPLGGVRYSVAGVDLDMVKLPPGRFIDGEGANRRELLVSRPFELGMTLVTQALWRAVMGGEPSNLRGEDLPVEQVSWEDVQEFLARLPGLGLLGFRLPTEAEWAWAARCGAPTRWVGADRAQSVAVVGARQTAPVAGLSSSAAGVFDLSGNLLEWQKDGWVQVPPAGVDAQGSASGSYRVRRGGSWSVVPQYARATFRFYGGPRSRHDNLGFRLLRASS
jgi:formylglycine-generating enzyme required for sulfatase activity